MTLISNVPYEEITIGQTATYRREVGERDIALFAAASGDVNPVIVDFERYPTVMTPGG